MNGYFALTDERGINLGFFGSVAEAETEKAAWAAAGYDVRRYRIKAVGPEIAYE